MATDTDSWRPSTSSEKPGRNWVKVNSYTGGYVDQPFGQTFVLGSEAPPPETAVELWIRYDVILKLKTGYSTDAGRATLRLSVSEWSRLSEQLLGEPMAALEPKLLQLINPLQLVTPLQRYSMVLSKLVVCADIGYVLRFPDRSTGTIAACHRSWVDRTVDPPVLRLDGDTAIPLTEVSLSGEKSIDPTKTVFEVSATDVPQINAFFERVIGIVEIDLLKYERAVAADWLWNHDRLELPPTDYVDRPLPPAEAPTKEPAPGTDWVPIAVDATPSSDLMAMKRERVPTQVETWYVRPELLEFYPGLGSLKIESYGCTVLPTGQRLTLGNLKTLTMFVSTPERVTLSSQLAQLVDPSARFHRWQLLRLAGLLPKSPGFQLKLTKEDRTATVYVDATWVVGAPGSYRLRLDGDRTVDLAVSDTDESILLLSHADAPTVNEFVDRLTPRDGGTFRMDPFRMPRPGVVYWFRTLRSA